MLIYHQVENDPPQGVSNEILSSGSGSDEGDNFTKQTNADKDNIMHR